MGGTAGLRGSTAWRRSRDRALAGLAAVLLVGGALGRMATLPAFWPDAAVLLPTLAALALAVRHARPATLLAAATVAALALIKLVQPHLALGAALAETLQLAGALGLNGRQLGKVAAEFALGATCVASATIAYRIADDMVGRRAALAAILLLGSLAATGAAADLVAMLLTGAAPGTAALLVVIEEAGETLAFTLGGLGFVLLWRGSGPTCRAPPPAAI